MPGGEFAGALLSGDSFLAQRRFEDSRQWFAKAQAVAPEAPHPLRGMVATYVAADDVEGALAFLAQRIEDKPDDAVAFFYRGELLAGQGKLEEAGTAFRETIRLHPEWLIPYQRLGAVLLQGGEEAEAIRVYREALQQSPDDPDLLNGLAMAHYTGGDPEGAIATYARLIEVQPDLEVAINNYAAMIADSAYEDQELLAHALELAARFRASDNADFLNTLGWLHYRKGEFAVATAFLERAVTLMADRPQFRYHLGMALERSGQKERAWAELTRAVESAPYPGLEEARATLEELRARIADAASG